jgi:CRISPR/Cas system CMR subunit Cmr6 (Cas7 group RAMP superfamily)
MSIEKVTFCRWIVHAGQHSTLLSVLPNHCCQVTLVLALMSPHFNFSDFQSMPLDIPLLFCLTVSQQIYFLFFVRSSSSLRDEKKLYMSLSFTDQLDNCSMCSSQTEFVFSAFP